MDRKENIMQFKFDAAVVITASPAGSQSRTPNRVYLELATRDGKFKVATDELTIAQAEQMLLLPFTIEGQATGSISKDFGQSLVIHDLNIVDITGALTKKTAAPSK